MSEPQSILRNPAAKTGIFVSALIIVALLGMAISSSGGVSSATVPQNACDGSVVVPFGRTECGSTSCTIATMAASCGMIITFPVAFGTAPIPGTGWIHFTERQAILGTRSVTTTTAYGPSTWPFFSLNTAGETWSSMPAVQTEIFGDNRHHWIQADWGNMTRADFVMGCTVGSNSATARILPQYSTDNGVTWVNMTTMELDMSGVDGIGDCDVAPAPTDTCQLALGSSFKNQCMIPIPIGAKVRNLTLRLTGINGGGVGDNPNLSYAYVITEGETSSTFSLVQSIKVRLQIVPTTTSFTPVCTDAYTQISTIVCNFYWTAYSSTG